MTDSPSTPPEGTPGVPPTDPTTPPPATTGTPGGYATAGGIMDAPVYAGPPATADDKTMAMLAHLLAIVTGFVGPLIIWLIKKDQSPFVNDQGKEALNFEITVAIAYVVVFILGMLTCFAHLLYAPLFIVNLIFCLMAGLKAKDGIAYRYPFALRFIK
jgi:hypothetical protein